MAPTIPTSEPDTIVAGDTVKWTKSLADFPPSEGWTVAYSIRGPSKLADADVVVVAGTSNYSVSIAAAKTAALQPGTYQWVVRATKAGETYTAETGVLEVTANVSTAAAGELVSHAARTLAVIEAAIEGRLTADVESYQVNGRAVTKIPIAELVKLRGVYAAKVQRERNPGQLGTPVDFQFTRTDGVVGTPSPVVLPWWYVR